MSERHESELHEDVRVNDEAVPRGLVVKLMIATLVITAALCILTAILLHAREAKLRPDLAFPERNLGPPHVVSMVRAAPFELHDRKSPLAEEQRARLDGYGWVDRDHGIVRIPIEHAIDLVARKGGAP